jgi:hypothetical protein
MLALVIVTAALATGLACIRELGSATFGVKDIAALGLGLLRGPAGLAVGCPGRPPSAGCSASPSSGAVTTALAVVGAVRAVASCRRDLAGN